jgi:spore germination protein
MNRITNRQLFLVLFLAVTSYKIIDIAHNMAKVAGRGSWIPILLAALLFGIAAIIITSLNKAYMGKMLFDYGKEITGKFISYIISVYYALYLAASFVYLNLKIANVIKPNFLPNTPEIIFILLGIVVAGFIATKGITNLARLIEIITPIFIVVSVFVTALALGQGIKFNVFPLFEKDKTLKYLIATKEAAFSFCGIELFLFIPLTYRNKKASLVAFLTYISTGLYFALVVLSCFSIIGINSVMYYEDSIVEALKLIRIPVFERADILYETLGFTALLLGKSLVYTVMADIVCRFFYKAKRWLVVTIIGAVMFLLQVFVFNTKSINEMLTGVLKISEIISIFIIPSILLIISQVKKHAQKTS